MTHIHAGRAQNVSLHCTVDPDCEDSDALACGVGDEHPADAELPRGLSQRPGGSGPPITVGPPAREGSEGEVHSRVAGARRLAGEHRRGQRDSPMALEGLLLVEELQDPARSAAGPVAT